MKIYNFSAGPSILPQSTIENTAEAVKNKSVTGPKIFRQLLTRLWLFLRNC